MLSMLSFIIAPGLLVTLVAMGSIFPVFCAQPIPFIFLFPNAKEDLHGNKVTKPFHLFLEGSGAIQTTGSSKKRAAFFIR